MPHRDEAARLCKKQEEHSIQHRQGLIEEDHRAVASSGRQRRQEKLERLEHAIAKRFADRRTVTG
jgi:hypothetical protein